MKVHVAFGKVMRKWRLARQMSQAELAEVCGLDRTFMSLLERGVRQPSLKTIFQVGKALKVSPSELVRQTERQIKWAPGTGALLSTKRL